MNLDWIVPVLTALGAVLGVVAKGWFDRKVTSATAVQVEADAGKVQSEGGKFDAEAASVIAATTVTLLVPLQREVAELRGRIDALEDENVRAKGKVRRAVSYIKELLAYIADHCPDGCPPPAPADLEL